MACMTTPDPNMRQLSPLPPGGPVAPETGGTAGSPRHAPPPPPRRRGALATLAAIVVAIVSFVYLVNPTLGIFELLPDNLPLVGNLDEAFFTLALASALGSLGLRIPFLPRR